MRISKALLALALLLLPRATYASISINPAVVTGDSVTLSWTDSCGGLVKFWPLPGYDFWGPYNGYWDGANNSKLFSNVPPGEYNWHVVCGMYDPFMDILWPEETSATGSFSIVQESNNPPTLTTPGIFPSNQIMAGTEVTFRIVYIDQDQDLPSSVQVNFVQNPAGYQSQNMSLSGGHAYSGIYEKSMTFSGSAAGTYTYYFKASDGKGEDVRYPAPGSELTLTVDPINHPPDITLPNVSPSTGATTENFRFWVHYSDSDGDVPQAIQIQINGTSYDLSLQAGSGTADDGIYETTIPGSAIGVGTHSFSFFADDGKMNGTSQVNTTASVVVEDPSPEIRVNVFRSSPKIADPGSVIHVTGYIENLGNTTLAGINYEIFVQSDFTDHTNFVSGRSIKRYHGTTGTIGPGDDEYFSVDVEVPVTLVNGWDYIVVINVEELSGESNTTDNKASAPILATVNNRGLELGPSCKSPEGGHPVNTALGNFVYQNVDLEYQGRGIPFQFERTYNSQGGIDSPIGAYWNHSYNIYLHEDVAEGSKNGNITVVYADGKRHKYTFNGSGYDAPLGVYRTLIKNGDNTYTITRKNLEKFHFNTTGQLVRMEDRFGNALIFSYTGENLSSVTDTSGRVITFIYQSYAGKDRIKTILGPLLPNLGADTRQKITYDYDSKGNLISFADSKSNTTTYVYSTTHDDSHLLTQVIDSRNNSDVINTYGKPEGTPSNHGYYVIKQVYADGGETLFNYDLGQRITTLTKPDSYQTRQYYDEYYRLTKEVDPDGNAYQYHYDEKGNRDWIVDKRGYRTSFDYDQLGNMISKTTPDGVTTFFEYTGYNDLMKKIEDYGQLNYAWVYHWDAEEKRLLQTEDPENNLISYAYNLYGQKIEEKLPENVMPTQYFYDGDQWGNLTKVIDPMGNEMTMEYDARGLVIKKTDSLGFWTEYIRDLNGNILEERTQIGSVFYEYDENNNRTAVVDRKNNRTNYGFDLKNRPNRVTAPLQRTTTTTYDTSDRKVSTVDNWGNETTFDYHPTGQLKTTYNPDDTTVTKYYDENGNLIRIIDGAGKEWLKSYDPMNRLVAETDPLGNTTGYEYDRIGRLTTRTDARGNATQFTYDKRNLLISVTDPEGGQSVFTYDGNGNRKTERDARLSTVSYGYDALNRLISITDRNEQTTTFTYHGSSSLYATKTNGNGETAHYTLYADRPLIQKAQNPGVMGEVVLNHDFSGNLLTIDDPAGRTSFSYDDVDRVTQVVDPFNNTVQYIYSPPEQQHQSQLVYPNGQRVTYVFDAMNRLRSVVDWQNTTTTYDYDSRGLLLSSVTSGGPRVDYTYDDAARLLEKVDTKPSGEIICSFHYTLDQVGNRIQVEMNVPTPPTFLAAQDLAGYDRENQITNWNDTTYSFDNAGRMTNSGGGGDSRTMSYRFDDRLNQITTGTGTWHYVYNGLGNRLSKTDGSYTKRYVLDLNGDMDRILMEMDAASTISASYIYGAGLLYRINPDGSRHHYHFDSLGSTVALTSNNIVTDGYSYDPYGKLLSHQGTDDNPFLYVGARGVMHEGGLLFMRARFYDPETNRFLSHDPAKGKDEDTRGMNPFLYAGANPIIAIDPEGREASTFKQKLWDRLSGKHSKLPDKVFFEELGHLINPFDGMNTISLKPVTSSRPTDIESYSRIQANSGSVVRAANTLDNAIQGPRNPMSIDIVMGEASQAMIVEAEEDVIRYTAKKVWELTPIEKATGGMGKTVEAAVGGAKMAFDSREAVEYVVDECIKDSCDTNQ